MDVSKALDFLLLCAKRELIELRVPLEQLEPEVALLWYSVCEEPSLNECESTSEEQWSTDQPALSPPAAVTLGPSLSELGTGNSLASSGRGLLSTSSDFLVLDIDTPEISGMSATHQSHDSHVISSPFETREESTHLASFDDDVSATHQSHDSHVMSTQSSEESTQLTSFYDPDTPECSDNVSLTHQSHDSHVMSTQSSHDSRNSSELTSFYDPDTPECSYDVSGTPQSHDSHVISTPSERSTTDDSQHSTQLVATLSFDISGTPQSFYRHVTQSPQSHDSHVSSCHHSLDESQMSVERLSSPPPSLSSTPEGYSISRQSRPLPSAVSKLTSAAMSVVEPSPASRWSSSEDESDADGKLEQLFSDMKLQTESKKKHIPSRKSLSVFIVSDSEEEDEEVVEISDESDQDSENVPPLYSSTPHHTAVEQPAAAATRYHHEWPTPSQPGRPLREQTNLSFSSPDVRDCRPIFSSKKSNQPPVTPSANKNFARSKNAMVSECFELFNSSVFDNQLPEHTKVMWNKKLRTTAGFCRCSGLPNSRVAAIELSTKVCDNYDRIRDTLLHEMCHAATWVVDGVKNDGHGRYWQAWARRSKMVYPGLTPVTRCHDYDITYKFVYQCIRCHYKIRRHSKVKDLENTKCPMCCSGLKLLPRLKADGTPMVERTPNQYALFVKAHYSAVKTRSPHRSHKEVMQKLCSQYRTSKTPLLSTATTATESTLDTSFTH